MKYTISTMEEMEKLAKETVSSLVPNIFSATVVGLYGELGAGKTTFTQSVARALGIGETVVSPTFVIEKIYRTVASSEHVASSFERLIHIDAYRLESGDELLKLGWKEIISDPKNLILIEWPERVADIMPEHTKVMINHLENETSREIEVVV
jgi:tRNA threonylcarbamoyladenosine biosynthesis protein TsaE